VNYDGASKGVSKCCRVGHEAIPVLYERRWELIFNQRGTKTRESEHESRRTDEDKDDGGRNVGMR
jgi:hypothetical protein